MTLVEHEWVDYEIVFTELNSKLSAFKDISMYLWVKWHLIAVNLMCPIERKTSSADYIIIISLCLM